MNLISAWQTLDVTLTAHIHACIGSKFIVTSYEANGKLLCIIIMHTCMFLNVNQEDVDTEPRCSEEQNSKASINLYTACMHVAIIVTYSYATWYTYYSYVPTCISIKTK